MRLAIQSHSIPEAAAYGKRGAAALARNLVREQCPKCGLWWKNLSRHTAACRPKAPPTPKGHAKCVECGRLVKIGCLSCFRCSGDEALLAAAMGCRW